MKKLLLILLCLPFIGFGQDNADDYCRCISKEIDKFDDIITYRSPFSSSISFTKIIDKNTNSESTYIYISVVGYTVNTSIKGVKILLENNQKLSWPEADVDVDVNYNAEYVYSSFIKLNKNEISKLKENHITDVRLYIYDKKIELPHQYKNYLMCIDKSKSKSDYNHTDNDCKFISGNEIEIEYELEIEDAESDEDVEIEIEEDDGEEFFMVVENMPEFPGGNLGLMKYIQKNLKYPAIAEEYNITGKVYVSFIVNKLGSITNVKVVRGVDKNLDAEAVRIVKSLPKYKPGTQRGNPVRVMFTIPINFTLN